MPEQFLDQKDRPLSASGNSMRAWNPPKGAPLVLRASPSAHETILGVRKIIIGKQSREFSWFLNKKREGRFPCLLGEMLSEDG
jgi:hypothetical protein